MGWSSGTDIVREVAEAINEHVSDVKTKRKLYKALVSACEDQDWDGQDEVAGIDPILDRVLGIDDWKYE